MCRLRQVSKMHAQQYKCVSEKYLANDSFGLGMILERCSEISGQGVYVAGIGDTSQSLKTRPTTRNIFYFGKARFCFAYWW